MRRSSASAIPLELLMCLLTPGFLAFSSQRGAKALLSFFKSPRGCSVGDVPCMRHRSCLQPSLFCFLKYKETCAKVQTRGHSCAQIQCASYFLMSVDARFSHALFLSIGRKQPWRGAKKNELWAVFLTQSPCVGAGISLHPGTSADNLLLSRPSSVSVGKYSCSLVFYAIKVEPEFP